MPGSRSKAEAACATILWVVHVSRLQVARLDYILILLIGDLTGIEFSQTFQAATSWSRQLGKVSWSKLRHDPKRTYFLGRLGEFRLDDEGA